MNPFDPTQIINQRQLKDQAPRRPAASMPPPGMPLPAQQAYQAAAAPYAPMAPPIPQPQPNFVPPIQQPRPAQPTSNAQTGARPAFSGIGGPAGSRPMPNAPMKPPMPTNGRPMMQSKKSSPMGS